MRCDVIYLLPKAEFKARRRKVSSARHIAIAASFAPSSALAIEPGSETVTGGKADAA